MPEASSNYVARLRRELALSMNLGDTSSADFMFDKSFHIADMATDGHPPDLSFGEEDFGEGEFSAEEISLCGEEFQELVFTDEGAGVATLSSEGALTASQRMKQKKGIKKGKKKVISKSTVIALGDGKLEREKQKADNEFVVVDEFVIVPVKEEKIGGYRVSMAEGGGESSRMW